MSPWGGSLVRDSGDKRVGLSNSAIIWRLVTTAAVVLACISLVFSAYLFVRNGEIRNEQIDQIRTSLIKACKIASDPQRHAVIGILKDEIDQSKAADLKQFFPQIPPGALKALIKEANDERRDHIRQLQSVPPCEDRY